MAVVVVAVVVVVVFDRKCLQDVGSMLGRNPHFLHGCDC